MTEPNDEAAVLIGQVSGNFTGMRVLEVEVYDDACEGPLHSGGSVTTDESGKVKQWIFGGRGIRCVVVADVSEVADTGFVRFGPPPFDTLRVQLTVR